MPAAHDVLARILEAGKAWIDPNDTVDRVTHGDGAKPVSRAAVAWMGTVRAARKAAEAGAQLLVVHEPIIWNHRDSDEVPANFDPQRAAAKRKLFDDLGLTVIRCHDLWDRFPKLGVCEAWPKSLGFEDFRVERYANGQIFALCRMAKGSTLGGVASAVAKGTARFGQQFVHAVGDPAMPVERLALNVGAGGCQMECMAEARDRFGVQAYAATEFSWWKAASWALDTGFGLLHVNHGVSECAAIESLHAWLQGEFPSIEWTSITEAAPYRMFGPDGPAPVDPDALRWQTFGASC